MALKLAGEESGVQQQADSLIYLPGLASSGDLESGTKTVSETSTPGSPDYAASLSVSAPTGCISVLRLCFRLRVTIDSFGGDPQATQLAYSVHVNGVERASGEWTGTGTHAMAVDLIEGQFVLGADNAIQVYLWVDQGNAVVSAVQVWLGVGSCNVVPNIASIIQVLHHGLLSLAAFLKRMGSGTPELLVASPDLPWLQFAGVSGDQAKLTVPALVARDSVLVCQGTVSTDINYIDVLVVNLWRVA